MNESGPNMANPLYNELFAQHAGKETPFLILDEGTVITHRAFLETAARYAHAITELGLVAGDRLAIQIEKSVGSLAIYAACAQSGVVFLPLNTGYTPTEVEYFLDNSGAKLLLCDPKSETNLHDVSSACGAQLLTLAANGTGSFAELANRFSAKYSTVDRASDDLAAFLYTSGTTGRSKGAMLTQENLLSNARTLVKSWEFSSNDTLLHALPVFHTHGLFVATNVMLLAGGAMIYLPKFDIESVIKHLPNTTTLMGVPTFYTRLLNDPRFDKNLTSHMRLFISGSAPLLAETHVQFETRTGHRILERYGMTETNMNTSNPYDGERIAGTVGPPLPGVELKITDPETGQSLPDGEIGQLEVRGPNVFKGYWQMPEKTGEELREDGFFITGDLGMIDDNGYVQIIGRNKDLIISGGYNIYPKEVELVIDEHPDILESAVIGVPHSDFGEATVAVLVLRDDQPIDTEQLAATLRTTLADYKQPKTIVTISELPRNTMGKVQKNLLREIYKDLFDA